MKCEVKYDNPDKNAKNANNIFAGYGHCTNVFDVQER